MSAEKLRRIRASLLAWYQEKRRDLPWRRTRDPYAIWIAETMLQQTQVRTVVPYYRRFLKAFPSVTALDRASEEEVLALWSGLGYYRRAKNLKKAARIIAREHGGKIPRDLHSLRSLPGIGPYTAGALLSIAFDRPYPALDGNARRVLTRLFGVHGSKQLHDMAATLASCAQPGEWSQALMELGATICVAQNPLCSHCPVMRSCHAWRSGQARRAAPSAATRRTAKVQWPLVVIQKGRKVLLRRRPASGLLAKLWEIPGGQRKNGESLSATLARCLNGLGDLAKDSVHVGEVRHSITYRRIRAPVFVLSRPKDKIGSAPGYRWIPISSLRRYPLSSLSLKAIELATQR
jgi:A/G-specific adenine glycosylase